VDGQVTHAAATVPDPQIGSIGMAAIAFDAGSRHFQRLAYVDSAQTPREQLLLQQSQQLVARCHTDTDMAELMRVVKDASSEDQQEVELAVAAVEQLVWQITTMDCLRKPPMLLAEGLLYHLRCIVNDTKATSVLRVDALKAMAALAVVELSRILSDLDAPSSLEDRTTETEIEQARVKLEEEMNTLDHAEIVSLLDEGPTDERGRVAASISDLLFFDNLCHTLVEAGIMEPLQRLLEETSCAASIQNERAGKAAIAVIGIVLHKVESSQAKEVLQTGVPFTLVQLLGCIWTEKSVVAEALLALGEVVTHFEEPETVVEAGAVRQLLQWVSEESLTSTMEKCCATLALWSLVCFSDDLRQAVAEDGAKTLIDMLSHEESVLQWASAVLLRRLVFASDSRCKLVAELGAIIPLVRLLQCASSPDDGRSDDCESTSELKDVDREKPVNLTDDLRTRAADILAVMSRNSPARVAQIIDAGAIPLLVRMLWAGTSGLERVLAASVLGNLAFRSASNSELIVREGALPWLVQLLRHEVPAIKAAFVLANLSAAGPEYAAHVVAAGAIEPLVQLLWRPYPNGSTSYQSVKPYGLSVTLTPDCRIPSYAMVAFAVRSLAYRSEERQRLLVAAEAVPPLVCMLRVQGTPPNAKKHAAQALGALTFYRLGCRAVRQAGITDRDLEVNGCPSSMHYIPSLGGRDTPASGRGVPSGERNMRREERRDLRGRERSSQLHQGHHADGW